MCVVNDVTPRHAMSGGILLMNPISQKEYGRIKKPSLIKEKAFLFCTSLKKIDEVFYKSL